MKEYKHSSKIVTAELDKKFGKLFIADEEGNLLEICPIELTVDHKFKNKASKLAIFSDIRILPKLESIYCI